MKEMPTEYQPAPDESPISLAALEEGVELPEEKPKRRRRKKLLVMLLILLLLGTATTLGSYYLLRSERVNLQAKRKLPEKIASGKDIQQAAFDSISSSLTEPAKTPSPLNQLSAGTIPTDVKEEKIVAPLAAGIVTTLATPPEALTTHPTKEPAPSSTPAPSVPPVATVASETPKSVAATPSQNQSIRFATLTQTSNANAHVTLPPASQAASFVSNKTAVAEKQTNLPTFGAMLPVRLLGVLYTLRQGTLARLELTRDLKTERWQLRRGTIFVGQVQSSARDRAYLQINGLLDPQTQTFTKLNGEVLGNDGGAGLRGKQRRIASAWMKVLDRTADAGVQIATGILNRRSSSVIVAADPTGMYRATMGNDSSRAEQNRDFVEVPAGTTGFVLVTTLPATTDAAHFAQTKDETDQLSDEELAALLLNADPARIRAALPQMSPALQRIAQMVLKELETGKP